MRTLAALLIGTIVHPTTAYAAVNVPVNDGILVWIFLGFFALIVVGQLIPAIMLIVGMVKGITAKTETKIDSKV